MTVSSAAPRWRQMALPLATFFVLAASIGSRPTVSLRAAELGMSTGEIGFLVALYALGPLVGVMALGSVLDRTGTRRMLPLAAVITMVGLSLPWVLQGAFGLYASQFVSGCGFTSFVLAGQRTAGSPSQDYEGRERSVAAFSLAVSLGGLAGPFYTGFIGGWLGLDLALPLAGVLALAALVFLPFLPEALTAAGEAAAPIEGPSRPWRVLGYHPLMGRALLVSALVLLGRDFYMAYFPLMAQANGFSAAWIGVIIGVHNGGGAVVRVFLLQLVRAFGKSNVIVASLLFSGVCMALLPFTTDLVAVLAVSLAMGMGLGLGQPLSITTTINLSPRGKTGEVLGFRLSSNRLTQFVTPIGFGAFATVAGLSGAFWLIGAIIALFSLRLRFPEGSG